LEGFSYGHGLKHEHPKQKERQSDENFGDWWLRNYWQKVSAYFKKKHQVIIAGRNSGDVTVDIEDSKSIETMLEKTGKVDAIISITGSAKWAAFKDMSEADFYIGLRNKLMGQVNLVRLGHKYVNEGGSITLSSGILADEPVDKTSSPAMVNGAIHSFVTAVSLELACQPRVNVVSCGLVEDAAEKYAGFFPGHNPIPMDKVVNCYAKSVEGKLNGKIIRMYDNH